MSSSRENGGADQQNGPPRKSGPKTYALHFGESDYPYDDGAILANRKALYLYIPMSFFHSNAVTLHNLAIDDADSKKYWHQAIENFIEMARTAYESSMRDEPSVVVLLHMLESQEAAYRTSGLMLVAYIRNPGWTAGQVQQDLLKKNLHDLQERKKAGGKKGASQETRYESQNLLNVYDLMRCMGAKNMATDNYERERQSIESLELSDESHPLNPLVTYSWHRAIALTMGAHDRYAQESTWFEGSMNARIHKIPDRNRCLRITHDKLRVNYLMHTFLPHREIDRMPVEDNVQKSMKGLVRQMPGVDVAGMGSSYYAAYGYRGNARQLYSAKVLHEANTTKLASIKERYLRKKADQSVSSQQLADDLNSEMEEFYSEALKEFEIYFSEQGEHSANVASAYQYYRQMCQKSGTMYRRFDKVTTNLSYLGDWVVVMHMLFEKVFKVSTAHQLLFVALMASYNASDPDRKRKLHFLLMGPPGVSKSFILDLVKLMNMPDTVTNLLHKTLRSQTSEGDFDETVEQQHEVGYDWLGTNTSGVGAQTKRSDHEATTKNVMDSGITNTHEMYFDENNTRRERTLTRLMNSVYMWCTNAFRSQVVPEVLDRMYVVDMPGHQRPGRSLRDLACEEDHPSFGQLQEHALDFTRRMHCILFIINLMIKCGILPTVSTANSKAMFHAVLSRGDTVGIGNTQCTRRMNRNLAMCRALCVVRAGLYTFSSILVPGSVPSELRHRMNLSHINQEHADQEALGIGAGPIRPETALEITSSGRKLPDEVDQVGEDDMQAVHKALQSARVEEQTPVPFAPPVRLTDFANVRWFLQDDDLTIPVLALSLNENQYVDRLQCAVVHALIHKRLPKLTKVFKRSDLYTDKDEAKAEAQRSDAERRQMEKRLADEREKAYQHYSYELPESVGTSVVDEVSVTNNLIASGLIEASDVAMRRVDSPGPDARPSMLDPARVDKYRLICRDVFRNVDEDKYIATRKLAKELMPHVRPRSRFEDVHRVLMTLTATPILLPSEANKEVYGETPTVMAIEVQGTDLLISKGLLEENRPDPFRHHLIEVLSHHQTVPATYLYGAPDVRRPYELGVVNIYPRADKQLERSVSFVNTYTYLSKGWISNIGGSSQGVADLSMKVFEPRPEKTDDAPTEHLLWAECVQQLGGTRKIVENFGLAPDTIMSKRLVTLTRRFRCLWQQRQLEKGDSVARYGRCPAILGVYPACLDNFGLIHPKTEKPMISDEQAVLASGVSCLSQLNSMMKEMNLTYSAPRGAKRICMVDDMDDGPAYSGGHAVLVG
jgi:hypothetical protein